jgi:hypothetical protein
MEASEHLSEEVAKIYTEFGLPYPNKKLHSLEVHAIICTLTNLAPVFNLCPNQETAQRVVTIICTSWHSHSKDGFASLQLTITSGHHNMPLEKHSYMHEGPVTDVFPSIGRRSGDPARCYYHQPGARISPYRDVFRAICSDPEQVAYIDVAGDGVIPLTSELGQMLTYYVQNAPAQVNDPSLTPVTVRGKTQYMMPLAQADRWRTFCRKTLQAGDELIGFRNLCAGCQSTTATQWSLTLSFIIIVS